MIADMKEKRACLPLSEISSQKEIQRILTVNLIGLSLQHTVCVMEE